MVSSSYRDPITDQRYAVVHEAHPDESLRQRALLSLPP
jgi:hypothetical protein